MRRWARAGVVAACASLLWGCYDPMPSIYLRNDTDQVIKLQFDAGRYAFDKTAEPGRTVTGFPRSKDVRRLRIVAGACTYIYEPPPLRLDFPLNYADYPTSFVLEADFVLRGVRADDSAAAPSDPQKAFSLSPASKACSDAP